MGSFKSRLFAALVFAFAVCGASSNARADAYTDALQGFLTDSYGDTADAIEAVVASGNPNTARVLEALHEGRLLYSAEAKAVLIKDAAGALTDAASAAAIAQTPADAEPVRLNNRLRGMLGGVIGGLTLMSPDPARRLEAAQSVFKSRDAGALPALDKALESESHPAVRRTMIEARAAIAISNAEADARDRLAAIEIVRERGGQDALSLLGTIAPDAPAEIRSAAADAIKTVQRSLAIWSLAQNTWYGLSLGSVLLLAAIGLAITFGVMGVINMAHGEMVMIGAYVTFVVQQLMRTYRPELLDYSLLIAVPAAFLIAGAIGVAIERGIIKFLYGRPLETLLATWGLSLILQQAVRTAFGPTNREVSNPTWMSGAFEIGQMTITYNRLWIVVFTVAVFAVLLAMLRFTRLGLEMRAVTQNRAMSGAMGIRTARIDALTFGLGSGIAGIAGVALSQIDNVSPNLGQSYIIDSFLVVVFGGVGNLWGTLVGALTLGIANKFLEPFAGAVLGKIAILVLIILFIQKRPRGMFALKGRAVEA